MKRLLLLAVLVLAAFSQVKSQEWVFKTIEADELKGTEADSVIYYDTEDFLVVLSQKQNKLSIVTKKGVFKCVGLEYTDLVTVGLYDTLSNLVEKLSFCGYGDINNPSLLIIRNYLMKMFNSKHPDNFMATRIIDYLLNEKGCVRFITHRYMDFDLDITIPCIDSTNVQQKQ